jgi:glycosyltransferase involved in cell wall biosynthesis
MKVSLDLSPLYSAHQYRGIGFYTLRLLDGLQELAKIKKNNLELELIKSTENIRFLETDLIHYPYFSPFFLSLPAKPLAPSIVTIHDLTPVSFQEHFLPGVKGKTRWLIQKKRLKRIAAVITDSNYWQKEISRLTNFPLEKIFVVPLAAGKEFKVIKDEKKLQQVRKKYRLPKKFILYVGDVNWNKNVAGLIRALALIKNRNLSLVLVGKAFEQKDLPETKAILKLIKTLQLAEKIRILGFLPTQELVLVDNLATVFCQPSFAEGFGLGVLEAMACGCPVVAVRTTSLPEVAGQAAVLVNPNQLESIAGGIIEAVGNRKKLVAKGFAQSQKFTWQKTAQQTLNIYEKIIKQRK